MTFIKCKPCVYRENPFYVSYVHKKARSRGLVGEGLKDLKTVDLARRYNSAMNHKAMI